jgi:capsular exopolysaccharide synthesis family protein
MDPLKTTAAPEARLHFLDYWRIIRIRKAVIISVFLLVSMTATLVTLFYLQESYSARARIKIQQDRPDRPGVQGESVAAGYDPFFIQTEFEIIQSELVLDKVITNLDLNGKWTDKYHRNAKLQTPESRRMLQGMIELRPVRNTSLIDISVFSDDKDEAPVIANAVAQVYASYRNDLWTNQLSTAIRAFTDAMSKQDEKVSQQETNVNALRVKYNVVDTDPNSSGPGSTLGPMNVIQLNSIKIQADSDAKKQQAQLETVKSLKESNPQQLRFTLPRLSPDPILSQLLQEYLQVDSQLAFQLGSLGQEHPDVKKNLELKGKLDKQIDEQVEGSIHAMETAVVTYTSVAAGAQLQLNEARTNDIKIAQETRPYWEAKAELDRMRRMKEVVDLRKFQEEIETGMPRTTMVTLVTTALVNPRPVRPNKPLNIALGIVIGLVVGLGLAFFIEYLDTSVKTIDDVERTLQSPVLGVIPQNVGSLVEEGAESPHAEAYRVLRTNLLFTRKDDKLNTVAVVSAGAGEGKSTTVSNLATVFAQSGQRVLMVDSDLRRPTLHKIMGVANSIGLTNYLLKQNTLEEVIQTTKLPSLHFMPSGKLPSSSLGILSSAQMKALITALKERYDYVFFDSPPIMGVSDASILASEVDMTLQVIQYRRYPQPMNIRAKQLIEKVGGNLVGIVLNNINMAQDESYYYYSGYYHDYYSKNDGETGPSSNGPSDEKSRLGIKPK